MHIIVGFSPHSITFQFFMQMCDDICYICEDMVDCSVSFSRFCISLDVFYPCNWIYQCHQECLCAKFEASLLQHIIVWNKNFLFNNNPITKYVHMTLVCFDYIEGCCCHSVDICNLQLAIMATRQKEKSPSHLHSHKILATLATSYT